jgi:hypothetical protein
MQADTKLNYLKISLKVFGVIYIGGIYLMMRWIFPEGWSWGPAQPEYEQMILGIYAVLGVYMFRAAKDPAANASLIWFVISSNIIHAGIMLYHAAMDKTEHANLVGDIPALFLVAFVLWYLMPKMDKAQ